MRMRCRSRDLAVWLGRVGWMGWRGREIVRDFVNLARLHVKVYLAWDVC
jgi:hypothetical protein